MVFDLITAKPQMKLVLIEKDSLPYKVYFGVALHDSLSEEGKAAEQGWWNSGSEGFPRISSMT